MLFKDPVGVCSRVRGRAAEEPGSHNGHPRMWLREKRVKRGLKVVRQCVNVNEMIKINAVIRAGCDQSVD